MIKPLEPGFYAMLLSNSFKDIDDLYNDEEKIHALRSHISTSPIRAVVFDAPAHEDAFYLVKLLNEERGVIMLGSRQCRGETQAEAIDRIREEMPDEDIPVAVMWLDMTPTATPTVTLH